MNRKTLLFVAVLAALGAGSALAATQAGGAHKPARTSLDANHDGVIDKAEAAAHPRLAERFADLDKNGDGKLSAEDYSWYLDTRRFGTVPHSGFGLGFERLVVYVCGLANIRDAIAYPRAPGSAEF